MRISHSSAPYRDEATIAMDTSNLHILTDADGRVIYTSQPDVNADFMLGAIESQSSGSRTIINAGEQCLVVWDRLQQADYTLISAIPYEEGMQELITLRTVVTILTIAIFILIMGICFTLARHNAQPMTLIQALVHPHEPTANTLHQSIILSRRS